MGLKVSFTNDNPKGKIGRYGLLSVFEEFQQREERIMVIDWVASGYKSAASCQTTIRRAGERYGFNYITRSRGNTVYVIKEG